MKKPYIVNKDVRINNEVRNKIARNTIESLNTDNQIFENVITNDNFVKQ